jgi:hypothetical protein
MNEREGCFCIRELQRLAGRADEFAQDSDVGAVHTDAASVDRQAEGFCEIEIHSCVVQFRKAVTLCRSNPIEARRINRPRRAMTAPRAASQLVKLLPIAFLPSGHSYKSRCWAASHVLLFYRKLTLIVLTARSQHWMLGFPKRFLSAHTAKTVRCHDSNDVRKRNHTAETR